MDLAQSCPPPEWPRISAAIVYDDLKAAIDWLATAFGFELRVLVQDGDGNIQHTEMEFGGGVIMLAQPGHLTAGAASPNSHGGLHTQSLSVFVGDIDAHHDRAKAAGAEIVRPLETQDYGDRSYGCLDFEGHPWFFSQRIDQKAWDDSIQEFTVGKS